MCLLWLGGGSAHRPTFRRGLDTHDLLRFLSHFEHRSMDLLPSLFMAEPQHFGRFSITGTGSIKHTLSRCIESSGERRPTQRMMSPACIDRASAFTGPPSLNARIVSFFPLDIAVKETCPPGPITGLLVTVPTNIFSRWSSLH